MHELPENKFGFICLGVMSDEGERVGLYVKANKIALIAHPDDDDIERDPW